MDWRTYVAGGLAAVAVLGGLFLALWLRNPNGDGGAEAHRNRREE